MAKRWEHNDEIAYYYDTHPTEEDLMGETADHSELAQYLLQVLKAHFQGQRCAIYHNLNFYHTANRREYPVAPDIAVIKGVDFRRVRSWRVGTTGPAPQVVLEIASEETWKKDLYEKPSKYAVMGVEEYFAYDPNERSLTRDGRLFGWRLHSASGTMRPLPVDPQGRLWSLHLESFLLPDNAYLRLSDSTGQLCLTRAEAEAQARHAEAQRADAGAQLAKAEAQRADAEAEARRAETRRADAGERRAKALAEKLRSLGIDPDQI